MKIFIIFLVILISYFLYKFVFRHFKSPKVASICIVNGGVKTGKTTFAMFIAISRWRIRVRIAKIKNFILKCFFSKKRVPIPLLYSNIPLTIPYTPITEDLILRKKRFVYGSVCYLGEFSLVADSTCIKNKEINSRLLMFFKLFGHETHGGLLVCDSQCINDCHYALKRTLSEYFYIHHMVKWIPFLLVFYVKECRYSDDGSIIQSQSEDVENDLKKVIVLKKYWKYFDCYCYSEFTDHLPVYKKVIKGNKDLKVKKIVTFKYDDVELQKYIDDKGEIH